MTTPIDNIRPAIPAQDAKATPRKSTATSRGRDVRCEISPDLHAKLHLIAKFQDVDLSRVAARLLEKAVVGEWHEFSQLLARMERSGVKDAGASPRRRAE